MPSSNRRRVSDSSEFRLIQAIRRQSSTGPGYSSLLKGIGDDAAIIQFIQNEHLLVSTDLLIEGIHFDLKLTSFREIGYRAIIANLSDIAAMGGIPRYVLTSVAIPPAYSQTDVRALYRGLLSCCHQYKLQLIGGDTSASKKGLFLGVTILGTVENSRALPRGGAKIGDTIYITGTLGDSWAGLKLLHSKRAQPTQRLEKRLSQFLINRHLRPTPRLEIGRWLSTHRLATAAIDLSDGLSGDLGHVCRESRVGAMIDAKKIPISPQCRSFARHKHLNPISIALEGGEDYELLFTVPAQHQTQLKDIERHDGVQITAIGTIEPRKHGMRIKLANGSSHPLVPTSYDHFRKKNRPV
ncbi:MAG: thiamine-phosphate kinase [Nitrospirota bacterium]|nr:MAG: thiamine-phosphate kinase [Nitrospirota bacterium]